MDSPFPVDSALFDAAVSLVNAIETLLERGLRRLADLIECAAEFAGWCNA